jgi:hypothetical protein
MMMTTIGTELVRWNATCFGSNYMRLDSTYGHKDKFMVWMSSTSFLKSRFSNTNEGRYAHSCLSSLTWWEIIKFVLKGLESLYAFLRFAGHDKFPN